MSIYDVLLQHWQFHYPTTAFIYTSYLLLALCVIVVSRHKTCNCLLSTVLQTYWTWHHVNTERRYVRRKFHLCERDYPTHHASLQSFHRRRMTAATQTIALISSLQCAGHKRQHRAASQVTNSLQLLTWTLTWKTFDKQHHPSIAALSVLVLSPLRAQQFGILCLTVCVIQLLGLISFDVTWKRICLCDIASR